MNDFWGGKQTDRLKECCKQIFFYHHHVDLELAFFCLNELLIEREKENQANIT